MRLELTPKSTGSRELEYRRSKLLEIITMTRMQKLMVALLSSAVRELVLPGYQEITNAHEIVAIEENGRSAEINFTPASLNLIQLVPGRAIATMWALSRYTITP
jgi:hypothetical protein